MKNLVVATAVALSITIGFVLKSRVDAGVYRQVQNNVHLEWLVTVHTASGPVKFEVRPDADLQHHFDGSVSWMSWSGYRTRVYGTFTVEPRYDEDWKSEDDQ